MMQFKLKNFDINKFNNDVNNSISPDNKYDRWAQYRADISSFISDAIIKKDIKGRTVVFGAGALNDVDLPFFCDAFTEVVLIDVDIKSINCGVERQKLDNKQKSRINVVEFDCSGAQRAKLFENLELLAARSASAQDIAEYIRKALFSLKPENEKLKNLDKFDLVFSCPVYTQLVYTQIELFLKILFEYNLYKYDELNIILSSAHEGMHVVIENYNDLMLSCLRDDGLIAVLTDMVELNNKDEKQEEITELLKNSESDISSIKTFVDNNGLDFAIVGIDDLINKIKVYDSLYTQWPFDTSKQYLSYLITGNKK